MWYNTKVVNTTQKLSKTKLFTALFMAAVFIVGGLQLKPTSKVDAASSVELRAQSSALQDQINASKQRIKELQAQAQTLQVKIEGLTAEISTANDQIRLTQVKLEELADRLVRTQAELDRQKGLLKASLRALYQKKGASPVELLIASESFSDFISNQEYLDRLQTSVKDSADEVVKLKQQIQAEQDEQKALLVEQENQRNILATKQQEQQQLLEQTKGDQRTYEGLVAGLLAQQQQVNAALFAAIRLESGNGNNGGYPYNDYAFSMTPGGCGPGEGPDRWNYCTRQCVSYAAWAVERSGRQAPVGYGNAKNWVNVAPASWQFNTPQAGDVGVATGGGYGHVVYIEQVYGDGTMRISQYNAQLTGSYSEATVSIYMFNKYIRFP